MKSIFVIFFLSMLTTYSQFVPSFTPFQDNARLGLLNRDSKVLTPQNPYGYNGYPVFEITVPSGYTEIQVRASLTNFEPGFLLKKDGVYIAHYIPTGEIINGKKKYKQLGTYEHPEVLDINEIFTIWDGTKWNFNDGALISSQLFSANAVENPWQCTNFTGGISGSTYSVQIEYFVYRTCTTGAAADAEWGLGSGDPDPWVYIANQTAVPGDNKEFKRQKWNSATSLTSQLQAPVTPIKQVDTATAAGTIGTSGNITVTVTGALVTGSPLVVSVAATATDTASVWAGKVRVALATLHHANIHDYIVGGTDTSISLTAREAAANDTTLNIALANGTTTGVTAAATSANTTEGRAGIAATPGYKVIFQPSRGNLGAAEWMQQNKDKLTWIYQVENVAGKPKHPNGSDVWNAMVPVEWRTNRIELFSGEAQAAATAYINAVTAAGVTVTSTQRSAILSFIQNEVLLGRWDGIKRLYFPVWGSPAANAICMKSLTSCTFNGAFTHASGYIQGGTNKYISLGTTLDGLGISPGSHYFAGLFKTAISSNNKAMLFSDLLISYGEEDLRVAVGGQSFVDGNSFSPSNMFGVISYGAQTTLASRYCRLRKASGVTIAAVQGGTLTGSFGTTNITFLGTTTSSYWDGQCGALTLGTYMSAADDTAYTAALETLWETCTGLTLP